MIAKFVYTALTMVFGGGTISDVTEGMNTVLNALSEALSQNSVHAILNIFLGVAASLMTVFLFMDKQRSKRYDHIGKINPYFYQVFHCNGCIDLLGGYCNIFIQVWNGCL